MIRGALVHRWSGQPPARRRATTSTRCPRIRSERPALDLHHPELQRTLDPGNRQLAKVFGPADQKDTVKMKVESWLFLGGIFFFTPVGIVYGYHDQLEGTGRLPGHCSCWSA